LIRSEAILHPAAMRPSHSDGLAVDLEQVRSWVDAAERVVVLTGAGISTDSGIPDFRGPQGVWTKDPEAEKMATIHHYMADPEIRRRSWRMKLAASDHERQPNAGHRALVELDRRRKLHLLVTQNVDGLHHDAGSDPERIVEIHGTLREYLCMGCGERGPIGLALDRVRSGDDDPACSVCGGILKSATISFGQGLVAEDLARAERAAQTCDLLLAVGSTLGVYPIAGVVPVAKHCGARIVIVNGAPTEMDELADAVLRGSISEILPHIL
jgi:NAD-dependent deacetylase